jgi:hypothetical protein
MHLAHKRLPRIFSALLLILTLCFNTATAQQTQSYPKIIGYFSMLNPISTYTNNKFSGNLSGVYVANFPFGINLIKSDNFGVSFEVSPSIRAENNTAKVTSIAFSPGALFRFQNNFAIIQRVAFETNGRFGVTTIFNKIIVKGKDASLFLAGPFATRLGNSAPVSLTTGLQIGVFF